MQPIETFEHQGRKIEIYQDENSGSPREWDNLGTFVNIHPNYTFGDVNRKYLPEKDKDTLVSLPVYLYDHSGITLMTKPTWDVWDSALIGYIYVTKERVREEYNVKKVSQKLRRKIEEILEQEIKTLNQYLQGDVYGFVIKEQCLDPEDDNYLDYVIVDSVCGYYGIEDCKLAAIGG